jgi:hypothetical protein
MAEPTLARVSPKLKDLTGRRFGRLIVIGLGPARSGSRTWLCRCECGNTKAALSGNLRSGKTKSCGCIRVQANQERNTTHGLALTPEYRVWLHIKGRCHTPTDANYQNYGGRGISVCQRWRDSFESFYSDMGPRPSARHSIDRVLPLGYQKSSVQKSADQSATDVRRENHDGCRVGRVGADTRRHDPDEDLPRLERRSGHRHASA